MKISQNYKNLNFGLFFKNKFVLGLFQNLENPEIIAHNTYYAQSLYLIETNIVITYGRSAANLQFLDSAICQ